MREFKFFGDHKETIQWRTAMGIVKDVRDMMPEHIFNILYLLRETDTIPNPHFGRTNREWIRIFCNEIERRGIRHERV